MRRTTSSPSREAASTGSTRLGDSTGKSSATTRLFTHAATTSIPSVGPASKSSPTIVPSRTSVFVQGSSTGMRSSPGRVLTRSPAS